MNITYFMKELRFVIFIKKLMSIIKRVKQDYSKISLLRTIYFNLKVLPLKQAIYLPIFIGRHTEFRNIKGDFIIEEKIELHPGIISFNVMIGPVSTKHEWGIIDNSGKLIFNGSEIHFFVGTVLWVSGTLILNGENVFGSNTLIVCHNQIEIGHNTGISWDCEIYDTNFHFFKDLINGHIIRRLGKIKIGDHVFVGNKVIITKSSIVNDGCIISNGSILNRSFKKDGCNLLIGGIPATVLATDMEKVKESGILDFKNEEELSKIYEK